MEKVRQLIPLRQSFSLIGCQATKAYAEIKCGRLKVIKNGPRSFLEEDEIERYREVLAAESAAQNGKAA